jgi:hypothetical protein
MNLEMEKKTLTSTPFKCFCLKPNFIEVKICGESTLRVNHFSSKKVMYNEYNNMQLVKILITSF